MQVFIVQKMWLLSQNILYTNFNVGKFCFYIILLFIYIQVVLNTNVSYFMLLFFHTKNDKKKYKHII